MNLILIFYYLIEVLIIKSNITKTILGGLVGTLMMSLMMKFAAPMMTGKEMDIAAMLGNMMGGVYAMGIAAHIMLGVLVFPLLYFTLLRHILPGTPIFKGLLFGILLWLVAETLIMPMVGAGVFMANIGGTKAVIAALMGHLVYGGLLGAFVSRASAGSRYFCESLFWASQPKQAAKT